MSTIHTPSSSSPADAANPSDHAHLLRLLSAMMAQIGALQHLVRDESADENDGATPAIDKAPCAMVWRPWSRWRATCSTRCAPSAMNEPRMPCPTCHWAEALSRLVDETAETLHLSSRVIFSGEERPLSAISSGCCIVSRAICSRKYSSTAGRAGCVSR